MKTISYYNVLGVSENATSDEIKRAYHEKSKLYHPDKHINSPLYQLASEKQKELNEAYEVLSNPEKRRTYDQEVKGELYILPRATEEFIIGIGLMEAGNLNESYTSFQKATILEPSFWEAYEMMGYISIEQRNYDQAMNLADKIISIVPNLVNGYILKSTLIIDLKQKHQIDLAIEISERIIQIDPELPIGYVNKALAYGIKDDVDKGISLLNSMSSKFKNAPEISWALSKLYLMKKNTSLNDIDSAERYFHKSIDGYNLSADQRAEAIRQFKREVAPKKAYNTAKAVGRGVINTVQDENFHKEIRDIFKMDDALGKVLKTGIGIWITLVMLFVIGIIISVIYFIVTD